VSTGYQLMRVLGPTKWLILFAIGLSLSWVEVPAVRVGAVETKPSADNPTKDPFAQQVRPVLAKYCFSCHGEKKKAAKLDLASFAAAKPQDWKHIWERVRGRQMPPADQPQPTAAERELLLSWIEGKFAGHTLDGRPDPGPLPPRRLNLREHMNTFRDLAFAKDSGRPRRTSYTNKPDGSVNIYQAVIPPAEHPCAFVARHLPQDTTDGRFDTIGDNLSVPPFLVEKYLRCSKTLLDDVLNAKPSVAREWPLFTSVARLRDGPLPKDQTQRQAVAAYLKDFASRAFRRPVTAEEVKKYVRLYDTALERGDDFDSAIRLPLQAILTSPRFVLLWADTPAGGRGKDAGPVHALDDYELAARLSYFLWSSIPDRELLQAAQQGKLRDPEGLELQTRRMLRDLRVLDGFLAGFLCQWLQLDKLDRATPDAERYAPYFQHNLGELMRSELLLFIDAILVEDRSILEFIDADWGFLCYPLAQHYGIDPFPGKKQAANVPPAWYRVKFADRTRGGALTSGKVLTGTSHPLRTSPVHRGKWVLETVLGTPPPPPPPDVDNVLKDEKVDGKRLTVPQLMARHRNNAACSSCHQMIDPLGLAFENFDPVGRWRDRDEDQPIDARGALSDGRKFDGVAEFKTALMARKDEFTRNFVEQMLAYALGRRLEFYDVATVKQITRAVAADDYKLSRVVVEIVKCYPFRNRRTESAGPKEDKP